MTRPRQHLDRGKRTLVHGCCMAEATWDKVKRLAAERECSASDIMREAIEDIPESRSMVAGDCACGRGPATFHRPGRAGACVECERERKAVR
jgi:hypothetical protein